jgi:RimJ/RimL family protein N-acetyltransferase
MAGAGQPEEIARRGDAVAPATDDHLIHTNDAESPALPTRSEDGGADTGEAMIHMQTKAETTRAGTLTIRPLRPGETEIVEQLFDRLGPRSRAMRFGGAKPILSDIELTALADITCRHHALVGFVTGDPAPAGIARLVVEADDRTTAEVACAIADDYQGQGVGTALMRALTADARAAGVQHLHATIVADNRRAVRLLRKVAAIEDIRFDGRDIDVTASIVALPGRDLRAA